MANDPLHGLPEVPSFEVTSSDAEDGKELRQAPVLREVRGARRRGRLTPALLERRARRHPELRGDRPRPRRADRVRVLALGGCRHPRRRDRAAHRCRRGRQRQAPGQRLPAPPRRWRGGLRRRRPTGRARRAPVLLHRPRRRRRLGARPGRHRGLDAGASSASSSAATRWPGRSWCRPPRSPADRLAEARQPPTRSTGPSSRTSTRSLTPSRFSTSRTGAGERAQVVVLDDLRSADAACRAAGDQLGGARGDEVRHPVRPAVGEGEREPVVAGEHVHRRAVGGAGPPAPVHEHAHAGSVPGERCHHVVRRAAVEAGEPGREGHGARLPRAPAAGPRRRLLRCSPPAGTAGARPRPHEVLHGQQRRPDPERHHQDDGGEGPRGRQHR